MHIGFAGLGDLGIPIAERLIAAGHTLSVWNRTPGKAAILLGRGAREVALPRDLAGEADHVVLCLTDAAAVEQVLFGNEGVCQPRPGPGLVIDHSTIHPRDARAIARRCALRGWRFVDAPVSGGAAGAMAGTLAVMAGGAQADVEEAGPILSAYAGRVTHMGDCGAGQAAKICNQIVNFGTVLALSEAFATARGQGLEVERMARAMGGGLADSSMLREYVRGRDTGDKPHMTFIIDSFARYFGGAQMPEMAGKLSFPLKDIEIAAELAREGSNRGAFATMIEAQFRELNGERDAGRAPGRPGS